jgi:hypothetical protein
MTTTPEVSPETPEITLDTSESKFKEAKVWSVGTIIMSAYAAVKFIENGNEDIAGRGASITAAVTGYYVFDSIKSARRLRREQDESSY